MSVSLHELMMWLRFALACFAVTTTLRGGLTEATSTCAQRVLIFGEEATYPQSMGFFSVASDENGTAIALQGRPLYSNEHGQVLLYPSPTLGWRVRGNESGDDSYIFAAATTTAACPSDVSEWFAWSEADSSWSTSVAVVKDAEIGKRWQSLAADVVGAPLNTQLRDSVALRLGASIALGCCSNSSTSTQFLLHGYRLFAEWCNTDGGVLVAGRRRHVEILLANDMSGELQTAENLWRLVDAGASLILGPVGSAASQVVAVTLAAINYLRAEAVLVLPDEVSTSIVQESVHIFNLAPAPEQKLVSSLQVLQSLGASQVHVVRSSDELHPEVCDAVSSAAAPLATAEMTANEGAIVATVQTLANLTTLDVVIGCMPAPLCSEFLLELEAQNVSCRAILLPNCAGYPEFHDAVGGAGKYLWGSQPWVPVLRDLTSSVGTVLRSSADFAEAVAQRHFGRQSRSMHVPAITAAGFAAAELLVKAATRARSSSASAVTLVLQQGFSMTSLYGDFTIDAATRRASLDWQPVQYMFDPNAGKIEDIIMGEDSLVYPMPPWSLRNCLQESRHSGGGLGLQPGDLAGDVCRVCTEPSLPHWRDNAWGSQPGWICTAIRCRSQGEFVLGDTVGLTLESFCRSCMDGFAPLPNRVPLPSYLNSMAYMEACAQCPPGRIEENEKCKLCEPGYESAANGSRTCSPCFNGTYTSMLGTTQCMACPSGRVASGMGSTACEECPPGSFADKVDGRAISCTLCLPGTYQELAGQTECDPCPKGADCESAGTSMLTNLPGWWLRILTQTNCTMGMELSNAANSTFEGGNVSSVAGTTGGPQECVSDTALQWFPCAYNGACRTHESCAKGSTGITCGVCLPRYSRISGQCVKCPPWGANLAISFGIGLFLCAGMVGLTAISIQGAGKAKSIVSVLLKLALNYSTTMIIMTNILELVLDKHSTTRQYRDPAASEARTAGLFRLTGGILGASVEDLQGGVWSLTCLWHPTLNSEDSEIIQAYADAPIDEKLLHEAGETKLREFHEFVEFRNLLFYSLIIPGMIVGLLIIVAVVLSIYMHIRRKFYEDVVNYFIRLGTKRIERAQKGMTSTKIERFHSMAEWRFLGIWKAVTLYRFRFSPYQVCYRYLHDALPLFVVIAFVLYPFCLRALLDPLRCIQPTDHVDGYRMDKSLDIECKGWQGGSRLITLSVLIAAGLGVSLPFFGGMVIYIKRQQFHQPHVQRTLNFLTGGYELDRSFWECVVLVRKTLGFVLAAVQMQLGTRLLAMVFLAGVFLFLHVRYQPFDNRYNELLDTVETIHLVAWNLFAALLLAIYMLDDDQEVVISGLLTGIIVVHLIFVVALFGALLKHVLTYYSLRAANEAAGRLQGAGVVSRPPLEDLAEVEYRAGRLLNGFLLRKYSNVMNGTPYLAATVSESGLLWITIGGNLGGRCPVPRVQRRHLNEVKYPQGVMEPSKRSVDYALNILFDAFEFVLVEHRQLACSASLMEFVLRVGFTFGVDGAFRLQEPEQLQLAAADGLKVEPTRLGSALSRFSSMFFGKSPASSSSDPLPHLATMSTDMGMDVDAAEAMEEGDPEEARKLKIQKSFKNVDSEAHKAQSIGRKWAGTRGTTRAIKQSQEKRHESYRRVVQKMYQTELFEQGLTLEELQLNLTAKLGGTSTPELKDWLDHFEEEWYQKREDWVETNEARIHAKAGRDGASLSVSTLRKEGVRDFVIQVHPEHFAPELLLEPISAVTTTMSAGDLPPAPPVVTKGPLLQLPEAFGSDISDGDEDGADGGSPVSPWNAPRGTLFGRRARMLEAANMMKSSSAAGWAWESPKLMRWTRLSLQLIASVQREVSFDCSFHKVASEIEQDARLKAIAKQQEESAAKLRQKTRIVEDEAARQEYELGARIASLRMEIKDVRTAWLSERTSMLRSADTYI